MRSGGGNPQRSTETADSAPTVDSGNPRPAGRVTACILLGLALLQAAWILTLPPFQGIDEIDHAFRASSVADGHVLPDYRPVDPELGRGDLIPVRRDIAEAARQPCFSFKYHGPGNCKPTAQLGADEVLIGCSAARYNPAFYFVTGYAAKPFKGNTALYVMRATSVVLCGLMLSATVWLLVRRSRTVWPLVFLLLALTPTTIYSTTVAAPNGLQMLGGAALWVALLALYTGNPDRRERGWLLALAAGASAVLLVTHTLGIMWLGLICLTILILVGRRRVLDRFRSMPRAHVLAGLTVLLSACWTVTWVAVARTNDPFAEPALYIGSAFPRVLIGIPLWPLQAIAAFPSREESGGPVVYAIALSLMLVLGVIAWRVTNSRTRYVLLAMVAASYAIPIVLTMITYSHAALAWQGRYGMPYDVGVFVVLGFALDALPTRPRFPLALSTTWLIPLFALLLVTQELFGMREVIHRVLRKPLWQDSSLWPPPPILLLTGLVLAAAALWTFGLRLVERHTR